MKEPSVKNNQFLPTDHRYFILPNIPYGTFSIHEMWPFGKIRSPFDSKQEAMEREIAIADAEGFLDTLILQNP